MLSDVSRIASSRRSQGNLFGFSTAGVSTAGDGICNKVWRRRNRDIFAGRLIFGRTVPGSGKIIHFNYGGGVMNNTADVTMTGVVASDRFGRTVAYAGDLNGDSYSDI